MTMIEHSPEARAASHRNHLQDANEPLAARARRVHLLAAMAMLFICALPDAMVVPVLRELMVDRYGVSIGAAHAFMSVNLLGALGAIGCVVALRRRGGTERAVVAAALLNGVLLAVMAMPIGFVATLAVRCAEGAADLIVYAVLFDVIARTGSASRRGRQMGAAATVMMLGIACGLGAGGLAGNYEPLLALWLGALACLVVAAIGFLALRRKVPRGAATFTASSTVRSARRGPLWPAIVMMFSDRVIGGLLATTVPLYLATVIKLSPGVIGGLIGSAMLMTALGTWPAGYLADRIGALRLRALAGVFYAAGLAAVGFAVRAHLAAALLDMLLIGLAGAALFASSLLVVCQSHRGPAGMGTYHLAGNLGFLIGPLFAGAMLTMLGGREPGPTAFAAVLVGFAIFHGAVTVLTVAVAGRTWRVAEPSVVMPSPLRDFS